MDWIPLRSSAIRRVAYDANTRQMYIDFENSDPHYSFCGVPESVYRGLISASSAGRYYNDHIKDRYDSF
ncbi:MAG: KTSC domain-containing protein [Candidatus Sedimenticola sp. (ex Thyasira tokunagai)]